MKKMDESYREIGEEKFMVGRGNECEEHSPIG